MSTQHLKDAVWRHVMLARHPKRPTAKLLISEVFEDFIELHGDRAVGDDKAIVGGIARLNGRPITIIAQEKGTTTEEKVTHNFGMPHPEGYRKALRLMKQAEKFNRPIVTIIDTPGAYPGIGAEERGQPRAIAVNLAEMMNISVPIISVVLSEGGSGGALAVGVSDEIWMFENAIYAILSPEGFASILYKDASKAKDIAPTMKLTAQDLHKEGLVERIIPEVEEGLHHDPSYSFNALKLALSESMDDLCAYNRHRLLADRFDKFRRIGDGNG